MFYIHHTHIYKIFPTTTTLSLKTPQISKSKSPVHENARTGASEKPKDVIEPRAAVPCAQ